MYIWEIGGSGMAKVRNPIKSPLIDKKGVAKQIARDHPCKYNYNVIIII